MQKLLLCLVVLGGGLRAYAEAGFGRVEGRQQQLQQLLLRDGRIGKGSSVTAPCWFW